MELFFERFGLPTFLLTSADETGDGAKPASGGGVGGGGELAVENLALEVEKLVVLVGQGC